MTSIRKTATKLLPLAAAVGALFLASGPASAYGALAIGMPDSIAEEGLAMGSSYRASSRAKAEEVALQYCENYQDAPKSTRDKCTVVHTFNNQCYAISLDPKAGTPGVGWYVADDKRTAEANALALCRASAGESRRAFCEISASNCDK